VNDNFGQWHSEKSKLIDHVSPGIANGAVNPRDQDYFVIKPQFSGFYSTNLVVLLPKLGVRRLILTGIATEICFLFTAADAHMRDYDLWIPNDAVVAIDQLQGDAALGIKRNTMGAETSGTARLELLARPVRAQLSVNINQLLTSDDRIVLQAVPTPVQPRELVAVYGRYSIQPPNGGTELAIFGSYGPLIPAVVGDRSIQRARASILDWT
jgi:hypothetical protein